MKWIWHQWDLTDNIMKGCVKILDAGRTSLVALVNTCLPFQTLADFGSVLIVNWKGWCIVWSCRVHAVNWYCSLMHSVGVCFCSCVSAGLCWIHVKWNQPPKYRNKKPTLTAACCLCIMFVFVPKVGRAFSLHNMCLTGTCCQALL